MERSNCSKGANLIEGEAGERRAGSVPGEDLQHGGWRISQRQHQGQDDHGGEANDHEPVDVGQNVGLGLHGMGQQGVGMGAYALGLAVTQYDFTPPIVTAALIGGPLVAAASAGLVAWLGFGPKVSALYISVITLVLSVIFVQVIYSGGDFTGSSSGLSNFDTFDIAMEGWFRIAGTFLVAVTSAGWIFVRSDFGRLLVAIRENEQRCRYCGIGTARVKALLLMGSAAITALAGFAYAGFNDVIAPDLGNFQFGTQLVIWVALGGRGTLIGPAVAAGPD